MYAMSEPAISMSVHSHSIANIQSELMTFGLNPKDWRALRPARNFRSQLILVHREDEDLKISVNVQPAKNRSQGSRISGVEMLVE